VLFLADEEMEGFYVHAHLLQSSSEYLLILIENKEEVERMHKVKLPEIDANAFSVYAKWLYTGSFHATGPGGEAFREMRWDEMSTCYELAGTLRASDFGDATIDAFLFRMEDRNESPIELAKLICEKPKKDSAHRKLCVDLAVFTWERKLLPEMLADGFPQEFFDDVFKQMADVLERGLRRKEVTIFLEISDLASIMSTSASAIRATS
jgi:hypothetical protein